MPAPTDFGSPKRPKKREKPKGNDLSLKLKVSGSPKETHKVLDRLGVSGSGDAPPLKAPGKNGPRQMHPTPGGMGRVSAPLLAKPLGQVKGKKPVISAVSTGVGDPPVELTGGVQGLTPETMPRTYTRAKKPSAKIKSNNPESPGKRGGPGGPKAYLPNGKSKKALNSNLLLKFPDEEPPKAGKKPPEVSNDMPPRMEPRKAPKQELYDLKIRRERVDSKMPAIKMKKEK